MFVLLKHFPPSKIKPYHYEDFWRYIEDPPRNKGYKLLCLCNDLKEVHEAIKKDVESWSEPQRRAYLKFWYEDDEPLSGRKKCGGKKKIGKRRPKGG